jgi:hypothetical protein
MESFKMRRKWGKLRASKGPGSGFNDDLGREIFDARIVVETSLETVRTI